MQNNEKSFAQAVENLIEGKVLTYDNILAMQEAFNYGTATPMSALIKLLRMIKAKTQDGNGIKYIDMENSEKTLCNENFDLFVLELFDDFTLKEVYREDAQIYTE